MSDRSGAYSFTFGGAALLALPSGALFWPDESLLCVGDLHLGRAERLARQGGALLPPYESTDTLQRLSGDLAASGARRILCLGDSFDDPGAADRLDPVLQENLWRLMAGREWIWVLGNHDPRPFGLGGTHLNEWVAGGLVFRHIAESRDGPEVSAHYHPKAILAGRSRPCFLLDEARLILPAYGTYTGGLSWQDAGLRALFAPAPLAILTGPRALPCPAPPLRKP